MVNGIVSCIIGCFAYSNILDWDLTRRELDNTGTRVAQFEFSTIVESFSNSFKVTYSQFFEFVKEPFMHRGVLVKLCVVIIVLVLIWEIIQLIKDKKFIRPFLVLVLLLLIPAGLNIIRILIPYSELRKMLQYQNILLVPFTFACIGYLAKYKIHKPVKAIASLAVIALAWTYFWAGNATYKCYELSYNHINSQMQIAVSRVYDLEGYMKDETPILMAGFPSDAVLKNNMDIYQYAENLYGNLAFWNDMHGATKNRYLYFLDYFGIDAKHFSDDEYIRIIDTGEFAGMPVWPDKGSVKMIDGYAVIKFTDEPPGE